VAFCIPLKPLFKGQNWSFSVNKAEQLVRGAHQIMSWTEQQIQMLKNMWGNGYSASEIAKHLGGMTRNAVIGKAHRLKLSSRPSPIKREDGDMGSIGTLTGSIPVVKSAPRKRVMLRPLPVIPTPPATVKAPIKDHLTAFDSLRRTEGIAVTKAGERHCRWPVGDPRSPDFRFCGCSAYESLPYCIDHARVAYQNMGRKQRGSDGHAPTEFRMPGQTRF
jgi:GcrA cell cycle regulator